VRRLAVLLLAGVIALPLVAGCGSYATKLRQAEAVAVFAPNATVAQRLAARAACSHLQNVVPEPLATSGRKSDQVYGVRFRIDHASGQDLARLTECLQKQPGVVGVETPESM
jgi:hypothetical protein